jgi:competence protein ComEA
MVGRINQEKPMSRQLFVRWTTILLTAVLATASLSSSAFAAETTGAAAAPASPKVPVTVDLNAANEDQLRSLPKIGPALAKRILEYRKQVGTFKSVDELRNVSGIGDKTLELLKPYLTVGSATPAPAPKPRA